MFVLGTAGHVDHGKSVLIHALTGIDPDRLREEKQRGMTIDLGFAWLKLPSGREVGIIDVPGHEHFIKNMLAGVGGVDLALFVIAANEGVMPQTKEHLAIIDLLGIKNGIIVVTKKDLVDEELLSLVAMEIEEIIALTTLSQAPIVPVSALTGEGMPELIATIERLLDSAQPREDKGKPRHFIDRVFTIVGSGTVVTGTLIDGSLKTGQEVEILPSGLKSRVRGLQTHKEKKDTVSPGSRVAVNLTGLAVSQLKRGDILTIPGWLTPTRLFTGRLVLLSSVKRPLRYHTMVGLHTGSSEVTARVRLLESDELKPGDTAWAQFVLSDPIAVVKGDRFIIRSPDDTLGGGEIIEPHTKRYRRNRPSTIESLSVKEKGSPADILLSILDSNQPQKKSGLIDSTGLTAKEATATIETLVQEEKIIALGQGEHSLLLTNQGWQKETQKISEVLESYHRKYTTREGIPRGELNNKLGFDAASFAAIIKKASEEGITIDEGATIRLASHQINLNREQQAKIDAFLHSLSQNPFAPPSDAIPESELLNLLIKQGQVVKLSDTVVFSTSAYNEMVSRITEHVKAHGKITLGETRDLFKTSRKYAQVLLEYLDQQKITRRVGDERVLGPGAD